MKAALGGIVSVVLLLVTSVVYAGHPAPGVQIIVNQGGATLFKAITDATGKFTTNPLEPGEYQFEVRGPRVIPPVRYFLVLGGARPVGQPLTNATGDLAMQAKVTRPTSIRGQVSSSRIIVLPGAAPAANSGPAATSSSSSNLRAVSPTTVAGQRQPPPSAARPTQATASSTTSTSGMAASRSAATQQPPSVSPASTAMNSSASASPSTQRPLQNHSAVTPIAAAGQTKVIAGKRYFWVPSAPGSKLGRWVPEKAQATPPQPAAAVRPATQSSSQAGR